MQSASADISSKLCLSCGLCCAGVICEEVGVAGELDSVRSAGLGILAENTDPKFLLPCILLQNRKCMIYATRFNKCRAYKCRLLDDCQKGEISFDLASRQIQKATQLYDKLREELGVKEGHQFWPMVREW